PDSPGAPASTLFPYTTLFRSTELFAGEEATRMGPPIGLLTGSTPARERRDVLGRLEAGELRLLVGTHALIEESVRFDRLALAVVDRKSTRLNSSHQIISYAVF